MENIQMTLNTSAQTAAAAFNQVPVQVPDLSQGLVPAEVTELAEANPAGKRERRDVGKNELKKDFENLLKKTQDQTNSDVNFKDEKVKTRKQSSLTAQEILQMASQNSGLQHGNRMNAPLEMPKKSDQAVRLGETTEVTREEVHASVKPMTQTTRNEIEQALVQAPMQQGLMQQEPMQFQGPKHFQNQVMNNAPRQPQTPALALTAGQQTGPRQEESTMETRFGEQPLKLRTLLEDALTMDDAVKSFLSEMNGEPSDYASTEFESPVPMPSPQPQVLISNKESGLATSAFVPTATLKPRQHGELNEAGSKKIENWDAIRLQTQSLVQKGEGSVRMKVVPEKLGEITISVEQRKGSVSVKLEATKPEVVEFLKEHQADLKQALLKGQNINVVQVDVKQAASVESWSGISKAPMTSSQWLSLTQNLAAPQKSTLSIPASTGLGNLGASENGVGLSSDRLGSNSMHRSDTSAFNAPKHQHAFEHQQSGSDRRQQAWENQVYGNI